MRTFPTTGTLWGQLSLVDDEKHITRDFEPLQRNNIRPFTQDFVVQQMTESI